MKTNVNAPLETKIVQIEALLILDCVLQQIISDKANLLNRTGRFKKSVLSFPVTSVSLKNRELSSALNDASQIAQEYWAL